MTNFIGGISQYDVDPNTGKLTAKDPATVPAGVFPAQIVVSPDGSSAYVPDVSANNILQYDVDPDDGTLTAKSTPTVSAGSNPRGIAASPDGESVYVTNQTGSNVSQYDVDPDDGTLAAKDPATVGAGTNPRSIALSPGGGSASVPNSGSSSVSQYDVDPDDGELTAKSPATVSAGNIPSGIAVRPDTIGPVTTIDSGPSGATARQDASFTFSADEPGSTFECSLDGAPFSSCSSPQGYAGLAEGPHSVSVRATDFTGNTGPVDTQAWTIDLTAPNTSINAGPSGTTADSTPMFRFASSQAGSSFRCSVDGGAFGPCTSPRTIGPLSEGSHNFRVRSTDPAGNTDASPATRAFEVETTKPDTTAPDTTIDKGPKKKVKTRKKKAKAKFEFSSDDPSASFDCSLDEHGFEPCTSPYEVKVKKGKHTLDVRATDDAGNVDQSPDRHAWKVKRKKG